MLVQIDASFEFNVKDCLSLRKITMIKRICLAKSYIYCYDLDKQKCLPKIIDQKYFWVNYFYSFHTVLSYCYLQRTFDLVMQ